MMTRPMTNKTKPKPTDPFLTHEALHMASFLMRSVDSELLEHPAIQENEDWSALAAKAHQALFDLYQSLGLSTLTKDLVPLSLPPLNNVDRKLETFKKNTLGDS